MDYGIRALVISGGGLDYGGYPLDSGFTALVSDGRSLEGCCTEDNGGMRGARRFATLSGGFYHAEKAAEEMAKRWSQLS